ncbi:hypothetical protein SeLEV6574_g05208 [Synchytrium endobioticum]|nr:hypothetical protein SeLEV6574_g05208 [Synchytrium endobioticum]
MAGVNNVTPSSDVNSSNRRQQKTRTCSPTAVDCSVGGSQHHPSIIKRTSMADLNDDIDQDEMECPLCLEEVDITDKYFKPCPCGYQICRFCWNKIKNDLDGRCPGCRRVYSEQTIEFKPVPPEELARIKNRKKQREREKKDQEISAKRHMASVRVVMKTLIYVFGLSSRVCTEETLRQLEYFGQFGKISKVLIGKRGHGHTPALASLANNGVYIMYAKKEDAAKALMSVDMTVWDGRSLRATYGTTKYCTYYLKNLPCSNINCQNMHEPAEEAEAWAKEEVVRLSTRDRTWRTPPFPILSEQARKDEKESSALPATASWAKTGQPQPPSIVQHRPTASVSSVSSSSSHPAAGITPEPDPESEPMSDSHDLDVPFLVAKESQRERKQRLRGKLTEHGVTNTPLTTIQQHPPYPIVHTAPPPGLVSRTPSSIPDTQQSELSSLTIPLSEEPTFGSRALADEDQPPSLLSQSFSSNIENPSNIIPYMPTPGSKFATVEAPSVEETDPVSLFNLHPKYSGPFDPFREDPLAFLASSTPPPSVTNPMSATPLRARPTRVSTSVDQPDFSSLNGIVPNRGASQQMPSQLSPNQRYARLQPSNTTTLSSSVLTPSSNFRFDPFRDEAILAVWHREATLTESQARDDVLVSSPPATDTRSKSGSRFERLFGSGTCDFYDDGVNPVRQERKERGFSPVEADPRWREATRALSSPQGVDSWHSPRTAQQGHRNVAPAFAGNVLPSNSRESLMLMQQQAAAAAAQQQHQQHMLAARVQAAYLAAGRSPPSQEEVLSQMMREAQLRERERNASGPRLVSGPLSSGEMSVGGRGLRDPAIMSILVGQQQVQSPLSSYQQHVEGGRSRLRIFDSVSIGQQGPGIEGQGFDSWNGHRGDQDRTTHPPDLLPGEQQDFHLGGEATVFFRGERPLPDPPDITRWGDQVGGGKNIDKLSLTKQDKAAPHAIVSSEASNALGLESLSGHTSQNVYSVNGIHSLYSSSGVASPTPSTEPSRSAGASSPEPLTPSRSIDSPALSKINSLSYQNNNDNDSSSHNQQSRMHVPLSSASPSATSPAPTSAIASKANEEVNISLSPHVAFPPLASSSPSSPMATASLPSRGKVVSISSSSGKTIPLGSCRTEKVVSSASPASASIKASVVTNNMSKTETKTDAKRSLKKSDSAVNWNKQNKADDRMFLVREPSQQQQSRGEITKTEPIVKAESASGVESTKSNEKERREVNLLEKPKLPNPLQVKGGGVSLPSSAIEQNPLDGRKRKTKTKNTAESRLKKVILGHSLASKGSQECLVTPDTASVDSNEAEALVDSSWLSGLNLGPSSSSSPATPKKKSKKRSHASNRVDTTSSNSVDSSTSMSPAPPKPLPPSTIPPPMPPTLSTEGLILSDVGVDLREYSNYGNKTARLDFGQIDSTTMPAKIWQDLQKKLTGLDAAFKTSPLSSPSRHADNGSSSKRMKPTMVASADARAAMLSMHIDPSAADTADWSVNVSSNGLSFSQPEIPAEGGAPDINTLQLSLSQLGQLSQLAQNLGTVSVEVHDGSSKGSAKSPPPLNLDSNNFVDQALESLAATASVLYEGLEAQVGRTSKGKKKGTDDVTVRSNVVWGKVADHISRLEEVASKLQGAASSPGTASTASLSGSTSDPPVGAACLDPHELRAKVKSIELVMKGMREARDPKKRQKDRIVDRKDAVVQALETIISMVRPAMNDYLNEADSEAGLPDVVEYQEDNYYALDHETQHLERDYVIQAYNPNMQFALSEIDVESWRTWLTGFDDRQSKRLDQHILPSGNDYLRQLLDSVRGMVVSADDTNSTTPNGSISPNPSLEYTQASEAASTTRLSPDNLNTRIDRTRKLSRSMSDVSVELPTPPPCMTRQSPKPTTADLDTNLEQVRHYINDLEKLLVEMVSVNRIGINRVAKLLGRNSLGFLEPVLYYHQIPFMSNVADLYDFMAAGDTTEGDDYGDEEFWIDEEEEWVDDEEDDEMGEEDYDGEGDEECLSPRDTSVATGLVS